MLVGLVVAQFGANALAASFYPTSIRSTGVSWALGIGRFGSILGPLIGGFLLSRNLPFADLFLIAAIPAACASLALLAFYYATRSHKPGLGVIEFRLFLCLIEEQLDGFERQKSLAAETRSNIGERSVGEGLEHGRTGRRADSPVECFPAYFSLH